MAEKKEKIYCTCSNSPGVYPESDDKGHWVTCQHCRKIIEDSYENFDFYQKMDENYSR